ncbi:hypothetical protein [Chiayiivirga flava]|uniref:Uncharacterized protein n=1 Tax=Chiayiivirga flava TaxID=659595 RepID=A0A7W8G1Q6_9GAMM|nr:hypothetical protein [Chiayiivirga flava]MBB5209649.1 hypothetical protein [Chiayiivirga flava]
MTRSTKALLAAATVTCLLVATGYATSILSLDACKKDLYALLAKRGEIVGANLLGDRVDLREDEVSSLVLGPFVVEATAVSPATAHGRVHIVRYLVLPWWRYAFDHDEFSLS